MRALAVSLIFALGALPAACSGGSPSPAGSTPPPAIGEAEGAAADRGAGGDPTAASRSNAGVPVRVHFDLASHVARAEVREGGRALVVDFAAPGAAKYTIGGFRTDTVPGELDGARVLFVRGRAGRVSIPVDTSSAAIALSARSMRPGALRLYVDDRELDVTVTPAAIGEASLLRATLPPDLPLGEHELLVRTPGTVDVRGAGSVGAAIGWVRVGPSTAPLATTAPRLPVADREGGVAALRIPAGITAGYALRVPEGARLRAVVRGGDVGVTAVRDGHAPMDLGGARAGASLDVDLGALAGEVVRIDLVAGDRDATLLRPAVVVPAPTEAERAAPARPRNVLLYLVDTLRADKLSPYSPGTRVRTPGLTRFLEGATVLGEARTQENWTKPSVATLLSSLMPWEHTATGGESIVPASVELLPEMLGARGFFTGSFIANGYVSDRFGFRQGWDTYRNYIREGRRTEAEHVAADVLRWLDTRPQDRPFLLYVHTIDPHVPYRPPDEFLRLYGDPAYRGPVSFRRDALMLEHIKSGQVPLAARDRAHLEALYDGEISYHDVHFAAILDGLERRGLADDTLVVVTSDHGEEFWDHGSVGHGHSVYDELLHVPLFVRHPGIADRMARVESPVGLVDVVPTILEALGVEAPADLSGRSFLPQLVGATTEAPSAVVSGFMDNFRTVVADGMKLHQRPLGRQTLYDLTTDRDEATDVAASRPIAVRYLRGLLGLRLAESQGTRAASTTRRAAPPHRPESREIDPETAAQLRALGYVH